MAWIVAGLIVAAALAADGGDGRDGVTRAVHGVERDAAAVHLVADDGFDGIDLLRDALAPVALALFDGLERDLHGAGAPLPAKVQRLLMPYFTDQHAGAVALTPATIERARFVVDAERMRDVFAVAPANTAAITLGDTIAFSAGSYEPDCIEGVALIGHELVHVAQYRALGREAFLDRYFLKDTLRQLVSGDGAEDAFDAMHGTLEVDAYCYQERICRALEQVGDLPPCNGRATARCATCPRSRQRAAPAPQAGTSAPPSARKPVATK